MLLDMMIFTLLLKLSEQGVYLTPLNLLFCSSLEFTIINSLTRFGVAPRLVITFHDLIIHFVLLLSIMQSNKFYWVNRAFSLQRGGA